MTIRRKSMLVIQFFSIFLSYLTKYRLPTLLFLYLRVHTYIKVLFRR